MFVERTLPLLQLEKDAEVAVAVGRGIAFRFRDVEVAQAGGRKFLGVMGTRQMSDGFVRTPLSILHTQ